MSPKGTIEYTDHWKTGYLVLSQKLNLPIITIGMDFHDHMIKLTTITRHYKNTYNIHNLITNNKYKIIVPYSNIHTIQDYIETYIMDGMRYIVPLEPKNSMVELNRKDYNSRLFGYNVYFLIIIMIIIIIMIKNYLM